VSEIDCRSCNEIKQPLPQGRGKTSLIFLRRTKFRELGSEMKTYSQTLLV